MKTQLTCQLCGSAFERESREHNRSVRLGRPSYCSRSCTGKANIVKNLPLDKRSNFDIGQFSSNKKDKYTGFRDHLRRAKKRDKEFNLTLDHLVEQWESQQGKCIYSGVELKHPFYDKKNDPIYTASLDRINSSEGYVIGNIQFVSMAMNYMKAEMSDSQVKELLNIISNNMIKKDKEQIFHND